MEELVEAVVVAVIVFVVLSMVFGLLWTPFAAGICLLVARIRRLDSNGYGRAGARYSLLFFWPWIYLALRMVGVSIPRIVERIGYALLYGLWASVAILFVTVSLYMVADRLVMGNDDVRTADTVLFFFLGLFIAVLWFISLRKLLRRHADHDDEPSIPMRVAQVALYALWLLVALGIFLEGMFEFRTFDKTDAAIPLWTCAAAVMALTWLAALKWFSFRTADRWDHPSNPRPDMLPSDTPYIMPFAHLYLLITVPAVAGIVVYVFGLILWLG